MKVTNETIKQEIETNPIFLKMIELKVNDMKNGIDRDMLSYKDDAINDLYEVAWKFQNNKEDVALLCEQVYIKIHLQELNKKMSGVTFERKAKKRENCLIDELN